MPSTRLMVLLRLIDYLAGLPAVAAGFGLDLGITIKRSWVTAVQQFKQTTLPTLEPSAVLAAHLFFHIARSFWCHGISDQLLVIGFTMHVETTAGICYHHIVGSEYAAALLAWHEHETCTALCELFALAWLGFKINER